LYRIGQPKKDLQVLLNYLTRRWVPRSALPSSP
ncbi:MAG: hypothetical protein ACI974_000530, partial [Paraglaciecola sp.]